MCGLISSLELTVTTGIYMSMECLVSHSIMVGVQRLETGGHFMWVVETGEQVQSMTLGYIQDS
jgi:hypothetical protein